MNYILLFLLTYKYTQANSQTNLKVIYLAAFVAICPTLAAIAMVKKTKYKYILTLVFILQIMLILFVLNEIKKLNNKNTEQKYDIQNFQNTLKITKESLIIAQEELEKSKQELEMARQEQDKTIQELQDKIKVKDLLIINGIKIETIDTLKQEIQTLSDKNKDLENTINFKNEQIQQDSGKCAKLINEVNVLKQQIQTMSEQMERGRKKYKNLQNEMSQLKEQLEK